ncbi:MAG: uroporphyrinogen decarboxylase family protein [Spirochaetota bacterium]
MTRKERIRTTMDHREPDRVPMFELTVANPVLESVLGRRIEGFGTGEAKAAGIRAGMRGAEARRALIKRNVEGMMEFFEKVGYEMFWFRPTDFLVTFAMGLPDDITANSIFDVSITEIKPNIFRIESLEHRFWSIEQYEPESDICVTITDSISRGGVSELRRYVDYLEKTADAPLHESLKDGLDAIGMAVEKQKARGDEGMFVLGAADIAFPTFLPYLPLFLETMIDDPALVGRYMEATTEGMMKILRTQLELGVDGILGAEDWCFSGGPLVSPGMFRRFMAPYLKLIVDECHARGVPYIKHLDGNTKILLDILVNEIGIDGLHSIEPAAGMDIAWVKKKYGDRIILLGNIDCASLLSFGGAEEVVEAVKYILRVASPGGGHIFSSSNSIHSGVKPETFWTMVNAVREYGTYPISIPS